MASISFNNNVIQQRQVQINQQTIENVQEYVYLRYLTKLDKQNQI